MVFKYILILLSNNAEGVLEWVRGAIGPKKFENQTPKVCPYISMYIRCRINKHKKLEKKGRRSQFKRQFSHINACHTVSEHGN